MKKLIIGGLVGGIILFFWQFFSWNVLHTSQMQYTANQDEILEFIDGKLEEGQYFLPNVPAGSSQEVHMSTMKEYEGKRWIQINYRDSLDMSMTSNLMRGISIDVIAAMLLCWLLGRMRDLDIKSAVLTSVGVGIIGYLSISYLNSIWFETTSIPDLIDAIVPWTLIGVWLGWWLGRK